MKALRETNPAVFAEKVLPLAMKHETTYTLTIGCLTRPRTDPAWTMISVGDGGEVLLAALRTPPFNLQLVGEPDTDEAALEALAEAVAEADPELPGVIGEETLCRRFSRVMERYGYGWEEFMPEGVYELTQARVFTTPSGIFRPAKPEDREMLARWYMQALVDFHTGQTITYENSLLTVQAWIDTVCVYLWEEAGTPVSIAITSRTTPHSVSVGAVFTPEEYRGRGYSQACVSHLSQQELDRGYRYVCLFTDLNNPISNHVYQKIGYRMVSKFVMIQYKK